MKFHLFSGLRVPALAVQFKLLDEQQPRLAFSSAVCAAIHSALTAFKIVVVAARPLCRLAACCAEGLAPVFGFFHLPGSARATGLVRGL